MRFSLLIASVAAIKLSGMPQEKGVPTCPVPCLALPNRVAGNKAAHKGWPTPANANPLDLNNRWRGNGEGDTVTTN